MGGVKLKKKLGKPISAYGKEGSDLDLLAQDLYELLEAIDYANHRRMFGIPIGDMSSKKDETNRKLKKYMPAKLADIIMMDDDYIIKNIHHIINYLVEKFPTFIRHDTMLEVFQMVLILRFEKGMKL